MGLPPKLEVLLYAVNTLLRKRRYHAALAVLKGFRNGAVYGAKIRAPHALVMTFLFRRGRACVPCNLVSRDRPSSFIPSWQPVLEINMYLLSRTLFGLARLAVEKGFIPEPKQDPFPLFSAVIWGLILWLFQYHRHTLQPSLQSSMTYLYDDSNVWHDISDFLIYNKSSSGK
ncbi:peroxisomal membrane protein 4 isoform X2 [Dromiciops gliroides]|uniref:peroxisomal membrane protein 4 isoform X2 n=1 Tax=Dromiciops gliroides TaxID=33562 RepID=UPI001CC63855|nr:peroxisomal membrane protein 4 isoform X2 [Dromiciops gliroides]